LTKGPVAAILEITEHRKSALCSRCTEGVTQGTQGLGVRRSPR
jgi:hypothetical protein